MFGKTIRTTTVRGGLRQLRDGVRLEQRGADMRHGPPISFLFRFFSLGMAREAVEERSAGAEQAIAIVLRAQGAALSGRFNETPAWPTGRRCR